MGRAPARLGALDRLNGAIDVRPALAAIRVPTLVVHQTGDPWVAIGRGRYLAEQHRRARASSSFLATVTLRGRRTWIVSSTRSGRFSSRPGAGAGRRPSRTACSRPCCSRDIVGSTARAVELGDRGWRELLEQHHQRVRRELARFRGVEHDTAGDGFFASFDGPARAIRCAGAIRDSLRELDLDVRLGLHAGECELLDGKVAGIAVSIGARVAGQAGPGEVLVSGTVKDLVAGSDLRFEDRGTATLRDVPGEWRLYAVA